MYKFCELAAGGSDPNIAAQVDTGNGISSAHPIGWERIDGRPTVYKNMKCTFVDSPESGCRRAVEALGVLVLLALQPSKSPRWCTPLVERTASQHPNFTAGISRKSGDIVREQTIVETECLEVAASIACYSGSFGSSPDISVWSTNKRRKPVSLNTGAVASIESGESHAVKSNEAIKRRQPQITIWTLADASDYILREALINGPSIDRDLRVRHRHQYGEADCGPESVVKSPPAHKTCRTLVVSEPRVRVIQNICVRRLGQPGRNGVVADYMARTREGEPGRKPVIRDWISILWRLKLCAACRHLPADTSCPSLPRRSALHPHSR